MSHLVSYKWIRKTQVIPEYVVFYKNSGKFPKIFTSNIRCIGNSILGFVGFPHIRKLCVNTKIIRRVFADKLVGVTWSFSDSMKN